MSDLEVIPQPAHLQTFATVTASRGSPEIQKFCMDWNHRAKRAGIHASVAMHMVTMGARTNANLVLTNADHIRQPADPPGPWRVSLSLALPSLGLNAGAPSRPLQSAQVVSRQPALANDKRRGGLAEDVVSMGGTVTATELEAAKVEATAPAKPLTDMDVVRAAMAVLLAHERIAPPFAMP